MPFVFERSNPSFCLSPMNRKIFGAWMNAKRRFFYASPPPPHPLFPLPWKRGVIQRYLSFQELPIVMCEISCMHNNIAEWHSRRIQSRWVQRSFVREVGDVSHQLQLQLAALHAPIAVIALVLASTRFVVSFTFTWVIESNNVQSKAIFLLPHR